jgi:dihydroflavonol-4-reductase
MYELKERGEYIRAIVRQGSGYDFIEPLADEIVYGDVTDGESLEKAFDGADIVYHLAGIIEIGKTDAKLIKAVNVDGTRKVAEAAKKAGIKRLVYVSSVHAIDFDTNDETIKEKDIFYPSKLKDDYSISKAEASNIVLDAVKNDGLNAVVLMPSGVTGPYAYRRSNIGQMIIEYANKRLAAYIDGEYDFVDVRDVARAMYAAADTDKIADGECFLLSGHKLSVREMMLTLQEITGVKASDIKLPLWVAKLFVPLAELLCKIKKIKPLYTKSSVEILNSNGNFDNSKAKETLGFAPMSAAQSLKDEYEFMLKIEPELFKKIPRK